MNHQSKTVIALCIVMMILGSFSTSLAEIPGTPVYLGNTTDPANFSINHTYQAAAGNGTTFFEVCINGNCSNTTSTFNLSIVSPHGNANITLRAWNSTGSGNWSTGQNSSNMTLPNNNLTQTLITSFTSNPKAYIGRGFNMTVPVLDPDGDPIIYGTNATNGTFNTTTGRFIWNTTGFNGSKIWYFNSTDGHGSTGNETINITILPDPGNPPQTQASSYYIATLIAVTGALYLKLRRKR